MTPSAPTSATSATSATAATPALAGLALPGDDAAEGSDPQAFVQALAAAAQATNTDASADAPALGRGTAKPTEPGAPHAGGRGHAAAAGADPGLVPACSTPPAPVTDEATETIALTTDAPNEPAAQTDAESDGDAAVASADLLAWLATLPLTPPAPSAAVATAGLAPPSDAADTETSVGARPRPRAGSVIDGPARGADDRANTAAMIDRSAPASDDTPASAAGTGAAITGQARAAAVRAAPAEAHAANGADHAVAPSVRAERAERALEAASPGTPQHAVAAPESAQGSEPQPPGWSAGWLGAMTAAAPHPNAAPAPAHAEVQATVGSKEFAPALGAQMSVLVRDGIEHAQLKLNPAELGPIEVRISIDGGQAQVDFSAAQALTRQALQDAVPALATALREQGLTLTGGGVFEQPREQRGDAPAQNPHPASAAPDRGAVEPLPGAAPPRSARARGVLDLYA